MSDDLTPPGGAKQAGVQGGNVLAVYAVAYGDEADPQTSLADLLADLMHHAAASRDLDFDAALESARRHFDAETL